RARLCMQPLPADRDRDELAAIYLVDSRNAFGRRIELMLPQHLARVGIAGAEHPVTRSADEQQPRPGRDRAAAWRLAADIVDTLFLEPPAGAVRYAPQGIAGVHVVSGEEGKR